MNEGVKARTLLIGLFSDRINYARSATGLNVVKVIIMNIN